MHLPRILLFLVTAIALTSCASSDDRLPSFPTSVSLGEGNLFPSIINDSLAVGDNRVIIQLIDADDNVLLDAAMAVAYYNLNGDKPVFSSESRARLISAELTFIDENNDFARTVTGDGGAYITHATFDTPGDWGAEITIVRDGDTTVIPYRFNVREESLEPGIGEPVPASEQATTATEPIVEIDSSFPTRDALHTTTIAAALQAGKPIVIAFATPAFCRTRTCGPVLDLVIDPLVEEYGADAVFIHIEPYLLRDLRQTNVQNPVPAVLEWRIQSEPWIFVVAPDGRLAAKFEGIIALDEVESALLPLLGDSGALATP